MSTIEVEVAAIAVDQPATKNKPAKSAAGDAKPKKAIVKKASTHPSFYEMVSDAIVTLKEKSGSSQYAIQKFTEDKHKQLPQNFRKLLLTQLKKFAASGKLVKVKNSYKLPATTKATAVPKPATKKSSVATKPKPTANKSTAKKAVSKAVTKPKTVAKAKTAVKPKSAASKPKAVAAKRKDVKPKAKPAKVAKKSAAASPSSKKAPAKVTKKVAVPMKKAAAKPKKVKRLSSVKSPAKRMSARKAAK